MQCFTKTFVIIVMVIVVVSAGKKRKKFKKNRCRGCCDNDGCPNGQPLVNCVVDPCTVTTCPGTPDAECVANYCGGCHADFFNSDGELACCGAHGQPCDTGLPIAREDDCTCQRGLLCFPGNVRYVTKGTCLTQQEVDDLGGIPPIRG
ncbi:uncharacterized protein LOC144864342 isoform X2 [Branchiostoma floridae x Branchiostoma japonicum]